MNWYLQATITKMHCFIVEPRLHSLARSFSRILLILLTLSSALCWTQEHSPKHKVIIDQDAAGPGGTDQQSILLLIQSPQTEVLGITVVTGDGWLKDEVAHTLRMLEIIGRSDIPVAAGAEYPLVRRIDETELWEQQYGSFAWLGVDPTPVSSAGPVGRNARRQAHDQTVGRGCRTFSGAHGQEVSARDHDLRGWTHDEFGPRDGD